MSHSSCSALSNARAFFTDHLFRQWSEQGHLPVLALEVLELRGLQPGEDSFIGRRQLRYEETVWDVVADFSLTS